MQLTLLTILGFVCGTALHAWLLPTRHDMSLAPTTVLGLAGSLTGCVYGPLLDVYDVAGLRLASFIASVIGACGMLLIGDQALRSGLRMRAARAPAMGPGLGQKIP